MHYWGDEWFRKNGNDLDAAISYIEENLHKHHIGVCGKEKYGTYRTDFLNMWNGSLYQILFGYRLYIGTFVKYPFKWMEKLANKFHKFIYWTIDMGLYGKYWKLEPDTPDFDKRYEEWEKSHWWKGFKYYMCKTRLFKMVRQHQIDMLNKTFQRACLKWPNVVDELICDTDCYFLIKPCEWGNIDGDVIHNKYWKKV